METRHANIGRFITADVTLFMPIFVTAPLFGVVCGLLLGALWQ